MTDETTSPAEKNLNGRGPPLRLHLAKTAMLQLINEEEFVSHSCNETLIAF